MLLANQLAKPSMHSLSSSNINKHMLFQLLQKAPLHPTNVGSSLPTFRQGTGTGAL